MNGQGKKMTIEELLDKPYWIIDILPKQVPKESPGQFFAVESYLLGKKRLSAIKERHIGLVLKLNCYKDISMGKEEEMNPAPAKLASAMRSGHLLVRVGDALILSEKDDTHMTLFNPDEELLELVRTLASSEGLYVWKGPVE